MPVGDPAYADRAGIDGVEDALVGDDELAADVLGGQLAVGDVVEVFGRSARVAR